MKRIQNIINMLGIIEENTSEKIDMLKGKYKYPYTFKEIYKVKKRELKYRKNGKGKISKT
tara:strand:- start:509 stop:688 length:180 start_codon:yes stop_codon:yes gene_type:complete